MPPDFYLQRHPGYGAAVLVLAVRRRSGAWPK